jgi:hypothetical protein
MKEIQYMLVHTYVSAINLSNVQVNPSARPTTTTSGSSAKGLETEQAPSPIS